MADMVAVPRPRKPRYINLNITVLVHLVPRPRKPRYINLNITVLVHTIGGQLRRMNSTGG